MGHFPWPMSNKQLQDRFSSENISIEELADMWIQLDQNEATKEEIIKLRETSNSNELENRLRQRIKFGTAG